jgi:hypothetical protein
MPNNEDLRLSENQWKVLHEVMQKTWKTMNGVRTMPPNFPKEVINALDENIRILYLDLLRLYDITDVLEREVLQSLFKGLFNTLDELSAIPAETLKNGDFAYLTTPVSPKITANIWRWNFLDGQWEDTGEPVPSLNEILAGIEQSNTDIQALQQEIEETKIDKAAAGDPGTFLQSVTVKEATSNGVIVTKWSRNVNTPGDPIPADMALPVASEEQAGVMPAESFSQVGENTVRISALEGRALHYSVTLDSASPSQEDLQEAYEEVSEEAGEAPDQVTLDDTAFGKSYTWYQTSGEWKDRGASTITQFTNSSMGIVKGDNAEGKVFAEEDGTGSVVGWDALKTQISNKAPLASPALTGTPTAPTAEPGTNNTQVATTAFVQAAILMDIYPIGKIIVQYPDEPSPVEAGLSGTWQNWSNKAIMYGIKSSNSGTPSMYLERQKCGNGLEDTDFAVGAQLSSGAYSGYYVREVVTAAGAFFGVEGGNRTSFGSGGKQIDRIRNFTFSGSFSGTVESGTAISGSGVFSNAQSNTIYGGTALAAVNTKLNFSASYSNSYSSQLPSNYGSDIAPLNIAVRLWRRVS